MGTLFIVSTPIGNLKDITSRALEVLSQVSLIACEDTRKTGQLLANFHLKKDQELTSFFEGNEQLKCSYILNKLLTGKNVALVSNAGTPAICDPGFKLIRTCQEAGIKIVPVPGVSAVLTALVASGLPTDRFLFLGFLPKKASHRQKFLRENVKSGLTTILYLSPYRLIQELEDIREILQDNPVVICREMTKVYEEVIKTKIKDYLERLNKEKPRGEFTLVFHLNP